MPEGPSERTNLMPLSHSTSHRVYVAKRILPVFTAHCGCGWQSQDVYSEGEAWSEHLDHVHREHDQAERGTAVVRDQDHASPDA